VVSGGSRFNTAEVAYNKTRDYRRAVPALPTLTVLRPVYTLATKSNSTQSTKVDRVDLAPYTLATKLKRRSTFGRQ